LRDVCQRERSERVLLSTITDVLAKLSERRRPSIADESLL